MKNQITMKKIAFIAIAAIGFTVNANAQTPASAIATASANIVEPISIVDVTDLVFSDIAVTTGGTVTIGLTNNISTSGAGVSLPATNTPTTAVFNVTGTAGYSYNYSLPTTFDLSDGATHTIAVSNFTSTYGNLAVNNSTLSGAGTDQIKIGAKITLVSGQTPGFYDNTTDFEITVNYN